MDFLRHIPRALHDEHMGTIALLERLEALLGRHRSTSPPEIETPEIAKLLKVLSRAIEAEIYPHFAFEEEFLFTKFAERGDNEMGDFLIAEHRAMLPLAKRLVELIAGARAAGFTSDSWAEFHATAAELVKGLMSHIQKEEMGLLPALDNLLDEDADNVLALEFAARR